MPPRNIRYADRAVIENLSWYYWVFNPIMIGLYGPLRTIIDLYFRVSLRQVFRLLFACYKYFYSCILLFFTLIISLSTALWGLSSSVIDFIYHPMMRSRRLRFHSSLLLTKIAIILGLFHFVCFNAYISYLTVAPTLCWLDKNCRSFPAEVSYGDFLISVPAVPAVKTYNFLTAPSTYEYAKLSKQQTIEKRDRVVFFLQVSAQTLAGIARAATESMPFSSATYLSEEEVDPGARYPGTAEETKTIARERNSGRGETSNKDVMIGLEHIPLSKIKEQPAANGNQGTKDLGGSKPTETLIDEKVELVIQPTLYQKLLKTCTRIITNFPAKAFLSAHSLYHTSGLRYVVLSLLDGDMSLFQGLRAATNHFWFIFIRSLYIAKMVHSYVVELVWDEVLAAENEPPAPRQLQF